MGNAQARGGGGGGGGGLRNSKAPIFPEPAAVNPLCYPPNPVNGTSALPQPASRQLRASRISSMRSLSTFGVHKRIEKPQQQPSSPSAKGSARGGRGCDGDKSSHRVSVAVGEANNVPHRLSISPSLNALESSRSISVTIASQSSSVTAKPRLTANKARDILLGIFFPPQGDLECVLSGFLTREDYARMRRFWVPFLTTELRDKWYIDAVMLSMLGRDRWQSWGQPKEATCVALSREEVMQLNQKRRECYGRLRECLTELSGALMEKGDHRGTKGNRETLLADSYCHEVAVAGVSAVESDGISCNRKDGRSLSRASNAKPHQLCVPGTTTTQRHEPLSVLLTRLQTTASTSFDCFHLIAARVPVAIVSSLSSQYFSSSTPVVYEQVAYHETKVGDLDALSFFVSIESRRQLLNGRVPAGMNRNATADVNGHINVDSGDFAPFTREDQADPIQTAQQLYSAVRHAGLVVTTACSSMVLTVLVHLADVLRERQVFRDNKAKAAQLGVTLEQLIGRKTASVHTYSDTAVEKLEKLKRDVVTGEMSLMVLTKELVARFLSENRAKMEKLRDCNPDLFAYLEMAATPEEKNDFDVTRLLSGIALKLMFLTGGGQRSIVADDRRVQADVNRMTDDVALSAMLEVPILNLICWIGCMMGVPITSSHGLLPPQHHGKPLTFIEMDECCGAMRVLFQAVGALPCGNACPQTIREWFPLFPFYAVNSEGKRVLVYLYTAQVTAIQRVPLKLQKDMTLPSFTAALKRATGRGLADICNYFFEPNFTVGHSPCNSDSSSDTASVDATQRSASAGEPLLPSMSGSSASWSKSTAFMHRTSPSLSPSPTTADGKSCRDERRSSSASSDASSSCSTLMEENLNIDVYTYTNPQMQLYLRCSDEATMRPHRVTELTPSVHTTFYCSTRDIEADRPDIAPALRHAVPKLLPSQGLLTLRWTSGEPLVTFCAGDLVCVMAERVATSVAGGGDATRMSSSSQQQQQQSRTSRPHDFTGAIPRVSEGNGTSEALMGEKEGATGAADNNSGNAAAARARTHLAIVDGPEKHSSDTVSSLHSHVGAHNTALEDDSMIMSSSSCVVAETARAYQGVMHDVLGLHEKVSRRIGVQWRVLEVLPCSPLARRSWRMSRANSLSAVAAVAEKQDESDRHNAYYREVVLHVTAPDMPFAVPLRILTIGHERASVSAFTFVNPNDDTVCWSNQNLIASVLNGDGNQDGGKSSHPGPNGLLCDTEEALPSIYYSIGVLLGNAITNGVHFTAPIAPLAFLLMKRAVMSGDYSSKNLMWLEPADGNLLSPALLLNSAYEILNMTDHQYVAFLHMRSLDNPDSHIFPVTHSLADEIREDKASLLQQQSRDTPNASIPLDHPLSTPRTPASVLGYLTSIQAYNRTGSAFHRSSCDMSNYSGDSGSCVHSFLRGAHVPVQDAIQEYRDQQQIKGKKSRAPPLVLNSHSNDQLHARLPSRREYISLYLANDLAWSPVRRDGHGAKNKELWVNMARGFMASSMAKSPLMTHCCSRVIREVLCVPRKHTQMGQGQVHRVSAIQPDSRHKCPTSTAKTTTTAAATPMMVVRPTKPLQPSARADAPAAASLSRPFIPASKAGNRQGENGYTIDGVCTATTPLPSVLRTPQKPDAGRYTGGSTGTPQRDNGHHHGSSNASVDSSYRGCMNSSRLLIPLALNFSDMDKVSGADSAGARHVYGSTPVLTAQANKHRESEVFETASVTGAEDVWKAPVGELECMASGFLSISDYIFVAESLKTLSARMLMEVGVNNRGIMSGGASAPLRQIVVDHRPEAATALTVSWAVMRDALVARKRGGGATGISGLASSATTAVPERDDRGDAECGARYSKMKSWDDAETTHACDETAPHLFNTAEANWGSDGEGLGSESDETTETGECTTVPTTPLTSLPMDTVAPMANRKGVSSVTGHVPDRVLFPHLPSQPLTAFTRVPAPPPRPLSISDLTAIAEQDDVVDFYLQSLAKRVRGIESKLRVLNASSVLRFFLTSALSSTDSFGTSVLLPVTASVPVRLPGCVDDSSAADPQSSGTWISKTEIVLPPMNKEEAQAAQIREDALVAMGGDLVKLFNDTKDITLHYMLIFAESMPLGINSRLNHDYLLPTAAIPENYVGCGVHARRKKDFFVSMTERVALLSGHQSFRTPEALLLGISQLSTLASQMMSSFALGAVLGCVSRWRELHKSGHTASDEVVETMERFATAYCTGYKILMDDASPTMRKQYPNLFIVSSFAVKEANSGGPPMLTVTMSMLMKLLFLFAGGRESIRADDRRMMVDALREEQQWRAERRTSTVAMLPVATATARLSGSVATTHARHERAGSPPPNAAFLAAPVEVDVTGNFSLVCSEGEAGDACTLSDDVALAVALQVPSATLIVDMGALLMSGPLAAHRSTAALVRTARAMSCVWRVLFQAAGLLPFGRACPVDMAKWLPLFPLYTLSTGAKHVMLSVYARVVGQTPLDFGPVLREDALQSAVDFIQDSAREQDEKLSVSVLGATTSEWSLHLSPTAIESSPASCKGGMSWPSTLRLGSPVVPVIAAAEEKPVTPVPAQRSYHLCPSFTAAPAQSWSGTLNEDSFHAKSTLQATPGMATEQRQEFYELCARQSAAPFLPGVNITNQVHAFPLPGGVAMLRVERLADHSPATVQRLKTHHDQLALIMSWRRVSLSHSHNCTPAAAMGQTGNASITTTVIGAPVHEGDELTIRWGNPPKGRAAATAMRLQTSFCNPRSFTNRRSFTAVQNIAASETAQAASAAAVLSAQELVDSSESHARVQGSHYPTLATAIRQKRRSLLFFAAAFSNAAPPSPPRSQKAFRAVSPEAVAAPAPAVEPTEERLPDVHVPAMQRSRICLILATANPSEFLVVLDTPNSIASGEAVSVLTPSVVGVLHHRRHCAPLTREVSRECAWTNPEFGQSASASVPAPVTPPLSWTPAGLSVMTPAIALQVPVLLGWLLGQSAGNDAIFTLPLPPLAFRILGLAVQLELPIDAVQLTTSDISLLHPDWTNTKLREQLLQGLRELHFRQETQREVQAAAALTNGAAGKRTVGRGILDDLSICGSPGAALRQHQRKKELIDISLSIMWNVQRNGTVAGHAFWAAVLQGMRQTPLLDTPLFAQCSSRTVRELLCGSYDRLDEDFTFRRSFMLLVEDDAKGRGSTAAGGAAIQLRGDRHFARKSVLRVLDELPLKEKRVLLRFITGHSLRTRRSQMDTLRLVLQSGFARAPPRGGKAKPPVCMPSGFSPTQTVGLATVGAGVVRAETASLAGADEDHSHVTVSSYLTASAEAAARACVDATLQLLPVAHPSERTLVFPNYLDALIMGSYRKRVLGADLPAFTHASGTAAAAGGHSGSCAVNYAENCVSVPASVNGNIAVPFFDNADVQLAWTQLTVAQQETLRRRYRELLRHRVRAALYVYLLSNADTVEEAWELGPQMGFASRAVHSGAASTTAGELAGCAGGKYNDDVGGGAFLRCDDGTVMFVERETNMKDDGVAGDVHAFGAEDDLDEDMEADDMVMAAATKEMTVDSATHAALEERGGSGADTSTPGDTSHAGQQKRPLLPSDQLTSSIGTLHSDLCGDSAKWDSMNGYCIAAAFRFPEDSDEDAGEAQTAAAGEEVFSGCGNGSTDSEATTPSATVTLHDDDAKADVARELARDGTQTSHPVPPASSGASAEAAKCPISDDQSLMSMVVASPRDSSLLKASMITPLWKPQMTAAAASASSSSMAFTDSAVKAAGTKIAVEATANGGSRDASMKAPSTADAAVTAHGIAGLSGESKGAHLRSEIDSCIRELFSDDAP